MDRKRNHASPPAVPVQRGVGPGTSMRPQMGVLNECSMTWEERCNLVLAFARVLYVNGQATDQTAAAAERIGQISGLRAKITPRWGALQLESDDGGAGLIRQVAADPTGVHMGRVASALRAMGGAEAGWATVKPTSTAIA